MRGSTASCRAFIGVGLSSACGYDMSCPHDHLSAIITFSCQLCDLALHYISMIASTIPLCSTVYVVINL